MRLSDLNTRFALVVAILISGCTAQQQAENVIVDTKGVNINAYELDLSECTDYAEQVSVAEKVAVSAAGGAVVGGVLGAIWKGPSVERSAGAGAVLGSVNGGQGAYRERRQVIRNCLRNRGYSILN